MSTHPLTFTVSFDNPKVDLREPGLRYLDVSVQAAAREPSADAEKPALPLNIALVIDRSGSMSSSCSRGERRQDGRPVSKLEMVKRATLAILDRLTPADRFALVTYDDEVRIDIPAGTVDDLDRAREIVQALRPGSCTNLSGGVEAGYAQLRPALSETTLSRVFLLSDGLANEGITDPEQLNKMARDAAREGMSLSTFGVGLDFDELLMAGMAENGRGSYAFLERASEIGPALASEFLAAREAVVKDARLTLTLDASVGIQRVFANLFEREGGVVRVSLGDMAAGEVRRALLRLEMPKLLSGTQVLGTAALRARLAAESGVELGESRELSVEYGAFSEAELEASLNPEIVERAAVFEARYARYDAAQARDEGRFDDARRMMGASMASMRAMPRRYRDSAALRQEMAESREYAGFMACEAPDPDEVLRMQKRVRARRQNLKKGE